MFPIILSSLVCLLNLTVAAVLVWKFKRTRDKGFILLGVAVFVWPGVSGLLHRGEDILTLRVTRSQWGEYFPFSLVAHGQMSVGSFLSTLRELELIIGAGLLLIAVLYLSKTRVDGQART
jgi:hypothetical protein